MACLLKSAPADTTIQERPDMPAAIENSGQAIIEDGSIVIRVALSALPMVIEGSWATGNLPMRYKITNPDEFAADLVSQLNQEDEGGTTAALYGPRCYPGRAGES